MRNLESVDSCALLDFDRTLINTDLVVSLTDTICQDSWLGSDIIGAYDEGLSRGESLDLWALIEKQAGTEFKDHIAANFIEAAATNPITYPDTDEFISGLEDLQIPAAICSTGKESSQVIKIVASGIKLPYYITEVREKGRLINALRTNEGNYALPPSVLAVVAKMIILVDDKSVSFTDMPADCFGYLVRRPEETILPSQLGAIPPNVEEVDGLLKIIPKLKAQS